MARLVKLIARHLEKLARPSAKLLGTFEASLVENLGRILGETFGKTLGETLNKILGATHQKTFVAALFEAANFVGETLRQLCRVEVVFEHLTQGTQRNASNSAPPTQLWFTNYATDS